MDRIESMKALNVIYRLKTYFAGHGIPTVLESDNGPPLDSEEHREFVKAYDFSIVTSCPRYPLSNGKADNAVKIFQHLLQKYSTARKRLEIRICR